MKRCEYPSWWHWVFQSDNRNTEPGFGAFVPMQIETSPQKMLSQQAEVQSLNSLLFQVRACLAKVSSKDADLNPFSLDALTAVPTPGSGPPVLRGLHHSLGINSFEDLIKNVHTDCRASFVDWSQPFQCIWEVTGCYFWSWCKRIDTYVPFPFPGSIWSALLTAFLKKHQCYSWVLFSTLSYPLLIHRWLCKIDPK